MNENFDFRNPDYDAVWHERRERLAYIRQHPEVLPGLRAFYKDHQADFINDWGVTFDPRRVDLGLDPLVPFVLMPKQAEWIDRVVQKWRARESMLTEKSRDSGVSYCATSLGCAICCFHPAVIGYGSRKAEYVDKTADSKSLFYKARLFMQELPPEFKGGWDASLHAFHMRILFPATGGIMTGESGDNVGRGDRTSIHFLDEYSYFEKPALAEAALSQTTNSRQYISTPNRPGDYFEQKRNSGKIEVFTFHWRDDPRKDDAWYAKQQAELDPVTVAREIDIDYSASVSGIIIPRAWAMACVDAHLKLHVEPTGERSGAFDVADEGKDLNAFCGARGILVEHLEEWSGKGDDIFGSVERSFSLCDRLKYRSFRYDADGLGAGVRGDARVINERRRAANVPVVTVNMFRGSDAVYRPEAEDVKGRKNKDYFANRKAQGWWSLRVRVQKTWRWVLEGKACDPDEIISFASGLPCLTKVISEISRPTWSQNNVGKVLVNKAPDGVPSPNLGDSVMMRFAPLTRGFSIGDDVLSKAAQNPGATSRSLRAR